MDLHIINQKIKWKNKPSKILAYVIFITIIWGHSNIYASKYDLGLKIEYPISNMLTATYFSDGLHFGSIGYGKTLVFT